LRVPQEDHLIFVIRTFELPDDSMNEQLDGRLTV
jgi:hypothetical protein